MIKEKKILMLLLFIPCLLIIKGLDNDIWFLLNSGRYVMNYGIPNIEPFTIHSNMGFVMQQWFTSVIYWNLYDSFGDLGLYFFIVICYFFIILIMYKITNIVTKNNFVISYTLTMLFSTYISFFIITRPIVVTLVLILTELYSLESYICTNNKKYLLILPILSLLSINLHAAMWPLLFIMLIPYIIDSFKFKIKIIESQGYKKGYIFIAILFMILFALFNPYGIKSMTYLLRSYGYPEISNYINEMLPPNINNVSGIITFSIIFIVSITYMVYREGSTLLRYVLLTLGTCVMALSSIRNLPFFVIGSVVSLAYYLKDLNINFNNRITPKVLRLRKLLIFTIVIISISSIYINSDNDLDNKEFVDLINTVNYITEFEEPNRIILYTGYNEGGYTEYMGLASYIDPRAEVFVKKNNRKDDIMKEYIDMQSGNIHYRTVLDKYNFTHLLVSKHDILNAYLPFDRDYEIIYFNDNYKLFKYCK